ncbi:hypothetical protein GCM10010255_48000 [Streptomyces coeruleofuscus]|uniref:Uncharacterized protein n=1 Tax=Streptomyces coeruleofuscus TaxID=66879 RepID=A0ABN3IK55_9ACTN
MRPEGARDRIDVRLRRVGVINHTRPAPREAPEAPPRPGYPAAFFAATTASKTCRFGTPAS